MGSVGSYRQFSFLSDDADTRVSLFVTPCVLSIICLPQSQREGITALAPHGVSCGEEEFSVPVTPLSSTRECDQADVAIGRSQRLGLTEDGKLLLWEVRAWIQQSHTA